MKLFGCTDKRQLKIRIVKNVPHLEIAKVVLFHCNVVNNIHLFQINHLVNYQNFHPKKFYLIQSFHILKVWFTDQNSKPLEMQIE